MPSAPLTPGVVYSVASSNGIGTGASSAMGHSYYDTNSVPCFDAGVLIDTPDGPRRVCEVAVGDPVTTLDGGPQPVRWRSSRRVALTGRAPDDQPILIPAHVLGGGRPTPDLIVSGQHRILVGHAQQGRGLLADEALVPAKSLVGVLGGVRRMPGRRQARWVHLALPKHSILSANGAYAESLLLGPVALRGIAPLRRIALRGMAAQGLIDLAARPARPCFAVSAARRAMAAHRARRVCTGA